MKKPFLLLLFFLAGSQLAIADGEGDNDPESVRQIPRVGIVVSEEETKALQSELALLGGQLNELKTSKSPIAVELLPDVEIYYRAVKDNLQFHEFFSPGDIKKAFGVLKTGRQRAAQLLKGDAPWQQQTGLVVRGYRSQLDGSAQPYGLVIPATGTIQGSGSLRLDVWFHGRGETLSETNFIDQRGKSPGIYQPAGTIVLHPYGRYSNAFKFAGEVDVLEALEHAKQHYPIDSNRVSVRGFSMGGAACWQFAVLYSDRWFAANPGAGFSETPEFLRFFQKETLHPYWWEEKLWHWYDADDSAINLYHTPTVAYSGEKDIQKQAADVMESALAKEGISLVHIIGPDSGHRIHADSQKVIERKMTSLARIGNEIIPKTVHKVTYSLKYNRQYWITIDALTEHWEAARVDAKILGPSSFEITSTGTTGLSFRMDPGFCPFDMTRSVQLTINGEEVVLPGPQSDRSWKASVHRAGSQWVGGKKAVTGLVKKHGLQGPIDDAFMGSFLMVTPTAKPINATIGDWVAREQEHAITHWRQHFRGHARVKQDVEVTEEDIADHHLILWGDYSSNTILRQLIRQLPIEWTNERVKIGSQRFDANRHVPVMIYPNPMNPEKYIVLNSGFTYREYAYLNNARQVAMLPDWAIVDVVTKPQPNDSIYRFPGIPVDANFFDEMWRVKPITPMVLQR